MDNQMNPTNGPLKFEFTATLTKSNWPPYWWKTQIVICMISVVVGLLQLISSSMFLMTLDILPLFAKSIGDCAKETFASQNPIICSAKSDYVAGGFCGFIATNIQIVGAVSLATSFRQGAWPTTSIIVSILLAVAFGLPMSNRADDLAAMLRTSKEATVPAMKIEFYSVMTAFNLIFTLFGIALICVVQCAADELNPPTQNQPQAQGQQQQPQPQLEPPPPQPAITTGRHVQTRHHDTRIQVV